MTRQALNHPGLRILGPLCAIQPEDTAIVALEEVVKLGIFRGSRKLDEEGGIRGELKVHWHKMDSRSGCQ